MITRPLVRYVPCALNSPPFPFDSPGSYNIQARDQVGPTYCGPKVLNQALFFSLLLLLLLLLRLLSTPNHTQTPYSDWTDTKITYNQIRSMLVYVYIGNLSSCVSKQSRMTSCMMDCERGLDANTS